MLSQSLATMRTGSISGGTVFTDCWEVYGGMLFNAAGTSCSLGEMLDRQVGGAIPQALSPKRSGFART